MNNKYSVATLDKSVKMVIIYKKQEIEQEVRI